MNRGYVYREQIDAAADGRTVLAHLAQRYTHSTEECWRARIEAGQVQLADHTARVDDVVRRGAWLTWHRPPWVEPDVPLSCDVLYEDAELLVVAKPRGLPTMPAGGFLEHTLLKVVERMAPGAVPMHRLGRGTSGIVVFARTSDSRRRLQTAWREHRVEKVYRALASGVAPRLAFVVEQPIGAMPHPTLGTVFAAARDGRRARSDVAVVEQRAHDFLADVKIETGRPHQIRIHLATVGNPLVGDPLYVAGGRAEKEALPGDGGYWLHARLLAMAHPRTGERFVVECEPPSQLKPGPAADG